MNFTIVQKCPIYFQMCDTNCCKQIETSHIKEKNTNNEPNLGFIVNPHKWNDTNVSPNHFQLPLVTMKEQILALAMDNLLKSYGDLKDLIATQQPSHQRQNMSMDGDQNRFDHY